jgi:hypothetical protein
MRKGVPMPEYLKQRLREQRSGKPVPEKCLKAATLANKGNKYAYKGENVSYRTLHAWLRMNKPKVERCELCGSTKKLEIANIKGHEYSRDLDDYMWLCTRCHIVMDGRLKNLIQFREG